MYVGKRMTRNPKTVSPDDPLSKAAGIPYLTATSVQADPGCGHHGGCGCGHKDPCGCGQKAHCGCEHAYPKDAGQAGAKCPCGMHDSTAAGHGGMHAMMHGKDAPPMKSEKWINS